MKTHIKNITSYNLWANQKLAKMLRDCNEQQFNQEIASSFSSIRKTVDHLRGVENGWLKSILKKPEPFFPIFEGSNSELLDNFIEGSKRFAEFGQQISEENLTEIFELSYEDKTYSFQVQHAVLHCMNHSTYHRGQIITMARQAGMENLPQMDFIDYIFKIGQATMRRADENI